MTYPKLGGECFGNVRNFHFLISPPMRKLQRGKAPH
jgi:hypothetical protein